MGHNKECHYDWAITWNPYKLKSFIRFKTSQKWYVYRIVKSGESGVIMILWTKNMGPK